MLLITLLVTLFDRYRPIHVAREQQRIEAFRRAHGLAWPALVPESCS